jgi:hypothetical protein
MGVAPESRHGCWQPWVSGLEIGRGDACRLGLAVMEPTYPCRWTVRRPGHLAISCKKFIVYGELGTASWPRVFSFPERSTRIGRIGIGVGKSRKRSFKRLEEPRARYLESSNGKACIAWHTSACWRRATSPRGVRWHLEIDKDMHILQSWSTIYIFALYYTSTTYTRIRKWRSRTTSAGRLPFFGELQDLIAARQRQAGMRSLGPAAGNVHRP